MAPLRSEQLIIGLKLARERNGKRMITEDSLLRHLPSIVDPIDRFETDALVFCHDIMSLALYRILNLAAQIDPSSLDFSQAASLFSDAWTIVDQTNVARQILTRRNKCEIGPVTSVFLNDANSARAMRNYMDHLPQQIPNRSSARGKNGPLFGAVSFVRCKEEVLEKAQIGDKIKVEFIVVCRGDFPGLQLKSQAPLSTFLVNKPITQVHLACHGHIFNLQVVYERLVHILEGYEEGFEHSIKEGIAKLADELGQPEKLLRTPTVTGFVAAQTFEIPFGSEEEIRNFSATQVLDE